jgi:hypothetical protein
LAQLKLLPPSRRIPRNHSRRHLALFGLLFELEQLAEALVVLLEQLQLSIALQRCGRLQPLLLG